jgi:leader peptidase (prepilin peptidase)/N-methyltransferase
MDVYQNTLLPALALLGLIVGSFLNVVIHRLPRMLERQWREQQQEEHDNSRESPRYDLIAPRSHCPSCERQLEARDLIPLLSWIWQRGRCRHCGHGISLRYPLVELLTAVAFVAAGLSFDSPVQIVAALLISAFLITLSAIDFDTHYLPDQLTLPLLWLGLAASVWMADPLSRFPVEPQQAILGALVGYLALWSVYWIFKLITGREGMGYGDFKLLAALGAWLGPLALIPIMLIASVSGSIVGLWLIFFQGRSRSEPIAFGPFIAAGGWLVMTFGSLW